MQFRAVAGFLLLSFCLQTEAFAQAEYPGFRDAINKPPAGWTGPVFKLNRAYPSTRPSPSAMPWMKFDPRDPSEQLRYLLALRAYVYEGNVETNWNGASNPVRKWFHVPWMAWGDNGREFIHGLTRERTSQPGELHSGQTWCWQNWAVSLYNDHGGFVTGRVWAEPSKPAPNAGSSFPIGTVVVKLLFTEAPNTGTHALPYLAGTIEWEANIHIVREDQRIGNNACPRTKMRERRTMRLLQIDVAVRDPRANKTTGWVFATFVYDKSAPGKTPWSRMVPLGLMWGNDPGVTPLLVSGGRKLLETWVNPYFQGRFRLGWAGRLNGPVDNPSSSCLSCHSRAQTELLPIRWTDRAVI